MLAYIKIIAHIISFCHGYSRPKTDINLKNLKSALTITFARFKTYTLLYLDICTCVAYVLFIEIRTEE